VTTHTADQTTGDESDCPQAGVGASAFDCPGGLHRERCCKSHAHGDKELVTVAYGRAGRTVGSQYSTEMTMVDRLTVLCAQ